MRHPIIDGDIKTIASLPLPWEDLGGRTVLVSGANGFLPAYMVETLLWRNEQVPQSERSMVVGMVRNAERARARFACYEGRLDLRLVVQDVCSPLEVSGPIDYIIHAASQASPKYYGVDPVGTLSANVLGTHRLLELAREKKSSRFLFFSSGEVYGTVTDEQVPTGEGEYGCLDPLDIRSCYAESKRMAENMVVSWFHQFGVPGLIVRPFHTYGPGMALDDGRVFADFVADMVCGRDIVMKSDGTASRAFCYLADAVAGFFTVLFRGETGTAYNIGNERAEISIGALAELLVGLVPEKRLKVVQSVTGSGQGYLKSPVSRVCPDTERARKLGWEPRTGLSDGFLRTIRSYDQ